MQTIFLVRHGETQWNAEDRMQGQIQHIGLTERGIRQSKLLAKRLSKEKISMVFSSPLERALQTAEIIAEPHGVAIITHAGLSERAMGIVDGMTREEIKKKHPEVWKVYESTRELPGIHGAENTKAVAERGFKAFVEISQQRQRKNIVIVSHGDTNKGIIGRISGISYTSFHQHNCCLNIIKYEGKNFKVEKIDDIAHLGTAGRNNPRK